MPGPNADPRFTAQMRELRTLRGLSYRDLGKLARYTHTYVWEIETGRKKPSLEFATKIDAALGAEGQLADLLHTPSNRLVAKKIQPVEIRLNQTSPLIGNEGRNDVDRRTFVTGIGGLLGLASTRQHFALETVRQDLITSLGVDAPDLSPDDWDQIVNDHGHSYLTVAPPRLLEELLLDLLAVGNASRAHQSNDVVLLHLRRAGALLASLMAMTVANVGQLNQAHRWWRTARHLATLSEDPNVLVWVRGREVVRALYEQRSLANVLRLIDDAYSMPELECASPSSHLELLSGQAQALASAGRSSQALHTLRRLQQAHAALPSQPSRPDDSIFSWSDDRLHFTESYTYSLLGHVKPAREAQNLALKAYSHTNSRGPAQIELQHALCLVRDGDANHGTDHARRIIERLPPSDHIRPVFDLAHQVLRAVPANSDRLSNVVEFRDCLRSADLVDGSYDPSRR